MAPVGPITEPVQKLLEVVRAALDKGDYALALQRLNVIEGILSKQLAAVRLARAAVEAVVLPGQQKE